MTSAASMPRFLMPGRNFHSPFTRRAARRAPPLLPAGVFMSRCADAAK